jgi:hypothetical protein
LLKEPSTSDKLRKSPLAAVGQRAPYMPLVSLESRALPIAYRLYRNFGTNLRDNFNPFYVLSFIGGKLRISASSESTQTAGRCDRHASAAVDPIRRSNAVQFEKIDLAGGIADECLEELRSRPSDPHLLRSSFGVTYEFIAPHARNDHDRAGLSWLAEKAADVDVPEAHLALADLESDPEKKLFHLKMAALILEKSERNEEAAAIRSRANEIDASEAVIERVRKRVANWNPVVPVKLPDDLEPMLRKAAKQ